MNFQKFGQTLSQTVSALFGRSPSNLPPQPQALQIAVPEVQIPYEAVLQIKDMTQIFLLIQEHCAKTGHAENFPEAHVKILAGKEAGEIGLGACIELSQQIETARREFAMNRAVDVPKMQQIMIHVTPMFSSRLASCLTYQRMLESVENINPSEDARALQTRLATSMKKGFEISAKLQELLTKSYALQPAPTVPAIRAP